MICSFAQRWSPLVIQESRDEEPFRPRILILVENGGELLAMENVAEKLSPPEVARWLKKHWKRGDQLWVDDSPLQAYLAEHLLEIRCHHRESLPTIEDVLQGLAEHLQVTEVSLVERLGAPRARQFYRTAQQFYRKSPWDTIDSETALSFRDSQQHEWGLVVMGSGGQEFGLALFEQPDDALAMLQGEPVLPTLGLSLAPAPLMAARDLDLLEAEGLQFPDGQFPWTIYQPGVNLPLNLHHTQELEWLLSHVPLFTQTLEPLVQDGRQLEYLEDDSTPTTAEWLASVFLTAWKKQTEHAWQLAELLAHFGSHWTFQKHRSPAEFSRMINTLIWLGSEYLALYSRKRKLVLDYLLAPPLPADLPRDIPAKFYRKLTSQLADFIRAH